MPLDLAKYDGSSGFLVDSNVWIYGIKSDSEFHDWAVDSLQQCSELAPLHINLIIYTELLVPGVSPSTLDEMLSVFNTNKSIMPWACAQLAAIAYAACRARGGARRSPLPDFYLGAHAAAANLTVLTNDRSVYRSYFPRVKLSENTNWGR